MALRTSVTSGPSVSWLRRARPQPRAAFPDPWVGAPSPVPVAGSPVVSPAPCTPRGRAVDACPVCGRGRAAGPDADAAPGGGCAACRGGARSRGRPGRRRSSCSCAARLAAYAVAVADGLRRQRVRRGGAVRLRHAVPARRAHGRGGAARRGDHAPATPLRAVRGRRRRRGARRWASCSRAAPGCCRATVLAGLRLRGRRRAAVDRAARARQGRRSSRREVERPVVAGAAAGADGEDVDLVRRAATAARPRARRAPVARVVERQRERRCGAGQPGEAAGELGGVAQPRSGSATGPASRRRSPGRGGRRRLAAAAGAARPAGAGRAAAAPLPAVPRRTCPAGRPLPSHRWPSRPPGRPRPARAGPPAARWCRARADRGGRGRRRHRRAVVGAAGADRQVRRAGRRRTPTPESPAAPRSLPPAARACADDREQTATPRRARARPARAAAAAGAPRRRAARARRGHGARTDGGHAAWPPRVGRLGGGGLGARAAGRPGPRRTAWAVADGPPRPRSSRASRTWSRSAGRRAAATPPAPRARRRRARARRRGRRAPALQPAHAPTCADGVVAALTGEQVGEGVRCRGAALTSLLLCSPSAVTGGTGAEPPGFRRPAGARARPRAGPGRGRSGSSPCPRRPRARGRPPATDSPVRSTSTRAARCSSGSRARAAWTVDGGVALGEGVARARPARPPRAAGTVGRAARRRARSRQALTTTRCSQVVTRASPRKPPAAR